MSDTLVFPDVMACIKIPIIQDMIAGEVIKVLKRRGYYVPVIELEGFDSWCRVSDRVVEFDIDNPTYGDYIQGLGLANSEWILSEGYASIHDLFVKSVGENRNNSSLNKNLVSILTSIGTVHLRLKVCTTIKFRLYQPTNGRKGVNDEISIDVVKATKWLKDNGYEY